MSTPKNIASVICLVVVALFAAYYGYEKRELLQHILRTLDLGIVIGAILLIAAGKFALIYIMQRSCERFSLRLTYCASFRIYNLSQMGKYLPGSLWYFAGLFAMLKERSASNRQIRDVVFSAHFWIVGSAAFFGILLVNYRYDVLLPRLVEAITSLDPAWTAGLLAASALVAGGLAVALLRRADLGRLQAWARSMLPPPGVLVALVFGWIAFGLAFWITTPPFFATPSPWLYAVGAYCLGYAAGFLVPFAPAGLGVREVVIAICMAPYLGLDYAILLASINRVLYFATEIILFSIALPLRTGEVAPPAA